MAAAFRVTVFVLAAIPAAWGLAGEGIQITHAAQRRTLVPIVLTSKASGAEQLAARELGRYLAILYPATDCEVVLDGKRRDRRKTIRLGTVKSAPALLQHSEAGQLPSEL